MNDYEIGIRGGAGEKSLSRFLGLAASQFCR
jgi:hypothetical protein